MFFFVFSACAFRKRRKRRFHITLPSVSLAILAFVVVLVVLVVVLVMLVAVLVMLVVVLVMVLVVVLVVLLVVIGLAFGRLPVMLRIFLIDVVDVYVVTPFYRAIEVVSLLESLPLSGCEHSPQLPVAAFPSV